MAARGIASNAVYTPPDAIHARIGYRGVRDFALYDLTAD
jgi:hypothetical protein